jgi:anti-sigma factor RsiW
MSDDDRQHENRSLHCCRRPNHPHYYLLAAGLAAGAAAFSSLAGVLFAGFFSSFLTTAGAGVEAAGADVAATAGVLAGSAAKAVTANADTRVAIIAFILVSF